MAVSLAFTVLERNDSQQITFTDTSTGWGGSNPNYNQILALTSQTYALTLNITVNSPSSSITYDPIDLYVLNGSTTFTSQSQLVFNIYSSNLKVSGSPLGISTTPLPDGIWDITYNLLYYTGGIWTTLSTLSNSILVYGQIKSAVYDRLMQVPQLYQLKASSRIINETAFFYTYLQAIEKSAFVAKRTELIAMLETLQRLLLNGSIYPW
jgi:hypothetical protein